MVQNINFQQAALSGTYYAGVMALTTGSVAYLQNRFNFVEVIRRFDPTYVAPSFKAAALLGVPVLGLECVSNLAEPYRPSGAAKDLIYRLFMTSVKTYVFIKGAEAIAKRGMPIHRGFIYQMAYIYALNSFGSGNTKGSNFLGELGALLLPGAWITARIWLTEKVGIGNLFRKFTGSYQTPPLMEVFSWTVLSQLAYMSVDELLLRVVEATNRLDDATRNTMRKVTVLVDLFIKYTTANRLNSYGFSISPPFRNFILFIEGIFVVIALKK
ncbi:MAG: hypothetical protein H7A38_03875 [Chlamydiales bacterium]|nr:hypothetical protein [Chlamydiales bacterium]